MFRLEKVLGVTVESTDSLVSSPGSNLIAYSAGSTVVLTNVSTNQQQYIINQSKKPVKSLAFSTCGQYLVVCEYGQSSCIKIWDIQGNPHQTGEIIPDEHGTRCFAISPNGSYLITLGYNFSLSVWDWKTRTKVTGSKVSAEVNGISFQENGEYFVTVGKKHIKYWYFDSTSITGKSAKCSDLLDTSFYDVACGKGKCSQYTYIVTRDGAIYMFNKQRIIQQLVELEIYINRIIVSEKYVFIGCAGAVILCFDSLTLDTLYHLPKCHHLGSEVNEEANVRHHLKDSRYPNTIALALNETTNSLISIYNDHSLYIWDLRDGYHTVTKSRSFLYHSNCIWDLKIASLSLEDAFITCSFDNTIRFWNRNNLNLTKIIYVDENYNYLTDKSANKKHGEEYGIRCMGISSDKTHFACGDRQGVVRIYRIPNMDLMLELEEHSSEVLTLDYTPVGSSHSLLASAGKDKQIFIFDVSRNYAVIEKIDDHTSSVTAVKFGLNARDQLIFVSSSSDGCCVISSLQWMDKKISFNIVHRVSLKRVLYTFELDKNIKYLLMACQSLKILDIDSKEIVKTLKPLSKVGFIFKIALDPLNKYICASCMDKSIIVYDFNTGNCLATLYSNLVTNLCFTLDCQKLITVTGDGCLFIWKNINENFALDGFNEDLLPTWAQKVASRSANIVMSTKSIIPKGKWASRMEKTISIKAVSTSDESEASATTPLSSHSDVNRYFEEHPAIREEEITKMESPSNRSRESSEEPQEMKPPIAPPRRKYRKGVEVKTQPSNSSESANSSTSSTTKTNPIGFGVKKTTNLVTKKDDKKSNISIQKRERASEVLGQVKEKSSKSMFDLSKPPPKGSWLSTYRTSVGEEKNQLWKQKSMSNLANSKYYSSENLNQLENNSEDQNKPDSQVVNANLNGGKRYAKKQINPGDKPSLSRPRPRLSLPKTDLLERAQTDPEIISRKKSSSKINDEEKIKSINKVLDTQIDDLSRDESKVSQLKSIASSPKRRTNPKLSLLKPHMFSRTQTDPEIIVRKKQQNESNLAKVNQALSASNTELNHTESLRDINISTAKVTEQLCEAVGNELVNTATRAVVLYKRFTKANTLSMANINALENLALSLVWAKIKLERLNIQKNKE